MGDSFKELLVWQRAVQMTVAVYKLTSEFPSNERFGLTNQLRRASVSVVSNTAAGYGRSCTGESLQFLGMAGGSNCEVQTQLVTAGELGFGKTDSRESASSLSEEVSRMLVSMMK